MAERHAVAHIDAAARAPSLRIFEFAQHRLRRRFRLLIRRNDALRSSADFSRRHIGRRPFLVRKHAVYMQLNPVRQQHNAHLIACLRPVAQAQRRFPTGTVQRKNDLSIAENTIESRRIC